MSTALAVEFENGTDPRARLRKLAGDTVENSDGALARLRALADSTEQQDSIKVVDAAPVIRHKPVIMRPVRPPSIVAVRDATAVRGSRNNKSEPGIIERAGSGIAGAIEETINHPVKTAISLVEAPISSLYRAVFAPSVGELPYDLRLTKGGNSRGQTALERNTPYTAERGAVTGKERTEAAVQTLANIAAGPIASKVTKIASPTVGKALGRTLGTTTAGAVANAAYTPDDPVAGAVIGAGLGGLLHVAGEGIAKGAKTTRRILRDTRDASTLRAQLKEMAEARNVAEREANMDALTGVANRNAYTKALSTAEADPNTSIVRFDVNGFKGVNDTQGHAVGDDALKVVAESIANAAEEHGVRARVFRVGGDEFAVLAPTDKAPLIRDRAEQIYGTREHGTDGNTVQTSISGGAGLTDAEADASSYARKQLRKTEQGITPREDTRVTIPKSESSSGVTRLKVTDIGVDPERFQFKRNTDPETGVSNELKNVQKFNEQLAGVISIWRDPANGKVYVVNGHHRVELAKRLNHPELNAQFIDAPDAKTARGIGALMNIAEGRGTPVDVAKFMRDAGVTTEALTTQGISLKGTLARQGNALSKLAPDVFDRVARGEVTEGHGAAIGETLDDAALQRTALSIVEKSGKRLNDTEVREVARQVRDAGTESVSQETLFGTEETKHALIVERAQLASAIKKRLATDKRIFGYVTKEGRAQDLERGGNVIDVEASRRIAQESARLEEVFNTLYTRSGPIAEALTEGARRIARGEKPTTVIDQLYPTVRTRVSEVFGNKVTESSSTPAAHPGQTALFSPINEPTRFGSRVRKLTGQNDIRAKEDVKALINISRGLAEAVGVPLAQGRFNAVQRRARGIFDPHAEITRVIRFDMLDTVAHEVGHYLSKKYLKNPANRGAASRGAIPLTKEMKDELVQMGRDLYGKRKPNAGYGEEGIAQWARFYVTEPDRLLRDAPKFSSMMEQDILAKEPALKAALDQAHSDFERYQAVPANERIGAMISVNERVRNMPTIRSLTTSWLDDLNEFKVAMNELGSTDNPRQNAYTLARLTRGAAGAAEEMLERGVTDFHTGERITKGVIDALRSIPPKRVQTFREYLIAERTLEKGQQGVDTGITLDDAKEVAENGRPEFEKVAKVLWEHSQALLRYRRDAGLLTSAEYSAIASRNQRRVGFYRVFDEFETASPKAWGKQKARNSSGIYAMKGSARQIIDPLESVISDTYKTISQARAHHAASTLLDLAINTEGGGKIAEQVPAPKRPVSVSLEQVKHQLMDLGIELPEAGLKDYSDYHLTGFEDMVVPGPNETRDLVIPIIKNGERLWVAVRDRRLYDAVKGLQKEEMTDLMRVLSFPARTLRAGATLTPEFIGRNPVRDMWSAAIYSRAGFRPPGWNFAKGMFHYLKSDDLYQRWKLEGGDNATMLGLDRPQIQKHLRDIMASKQRRALNIVIHPIDTLRMVSSLMENATRIGEYAAVEAKQLKAGASARVAGTEGALAARDVSIDFPRAGTKGRAVNQIIAFFNASIQSTAKLMTELKTRPHVVLPRILASITLPSIYLHLTQKDDPTYQELPRWQKDLFWIVIDRDEKGALQHIWRIPKPFELGVMFGTVPERILEYADKHDPEAVESALSAVQRAFTPPIWPTAISPLIENWANHSTYTDRPIVPRTTEGLDPGFQAAPYTGETARAIGEGVDYSPAKIENTVRGYAGGLGEYALRGADAGVRVVRDFKKLPSMTPGLDTRTDRLDRIPAARAFIAREPASDAESVERIYREFEEAERKRRTWRVLREQGRTGEAQEFFQKHREEILSVATRDETGAEPGKLRAAYETLQKFGEGRKDITRARATPADKATRVRSLDKRLVRYARQQRERLLK